VAEDEEADSEGFAALVVVTARGVIFADADASMSMAAVPVAAEASALASSGTWSFLDRATV
jgi:hypothetical protein